MRRLRALTVVFTVIALPSPVRVVVLSDPHPYYTVAVRLSDLGIVAVFLLSLPDLVRALRRPSAIGALTTALGVLLLLAFAIHPSAQGAQTLTRYFGSAALAFAILRIPVGHDRNLLFFALAATAASQSLLSGAQLIAADLLVPYAHPPIITFGPFIRTIGTFSDTFVLAGYALVIAAWLAREALAQPARRWWPVLVAIALVPVGYSFSRAAAVAAALMTVPLLRRGAGDAPGYRLLLAAMLVGTVVPAALTRDGWVGREASTSVTTSADIRANLITQTFPLLAQQPLVGIGPGNTLDALRHLDTRLPGEGYLEPPHDVPYLIALEAGIPAGIVALALMLLIGLRTWREPGRMIAFVSLLTFLLLDNFPWTAPNGLPLVALWASASLALTSDGPTAGASSRG